MENGENGVECFGSNVRKIERLHIARCTTMHHNGSSVDGLYVFGPACEVDLYGPKMGIHSNEEYGICAITWADVDIHLLSQHNTTQPMTMLEGIDIKTIMGSIANINADGTFTHALPIESLVAM